MNAGSQSDLTQRLGAVAAQIEALLDRLLSEKPMPGEITRPPRLVAAMRHAVLGGGKRLRPFLLVESAGLFSVPRENALVAGAALECLHGYSLIHDDLPAMDDDDLRRGRPTVHKAFDDATAILAGDALLTLAFDAMVRTEVHPDRALRWSRNLPRQQAWAAWPAGRCSTLPPKAASSQNAF
jgi:farnesyl diphosphate synthase